MESSDSDYPYEETIVNNVETVNIGNHDSSSDENERELKGPVGLYQGGNRTDYARKQAQKRGVEVQVMGGVGSNGRYQPRIVGNPNAAIYQKPGIQRNPPPPPGYIGGGRKGNGNSKSPKKIKSPKTTNQKYHDMRKKSMEHRKKSFEKYKKEAQSNYYFKFITPNLLFKFFIFF